MNPAARTSYIRCSTCGRYLRGAPEVKHGYCSEACAASYARCVICGDFYLAERSYRERYCSEACAAAYEFSEKRRSTLVNELSYQPD